MAVNNEILYAEKLRQRRQEVQLTLRHIENERRQIEANTEWLDRAAYESRAGLLDRLSTWYQKEIGRLEGAINRAQKRADGLCSSCHKPIDAARQEIFSQTNFCVDCQEFRGRFKTG